MVDITFQYDQLKKDDKKLFDSMNESEREAFINTWVLIEKQKVRLQQQRNRSKNRIKRERKVLVEQERKARTHRLIERGALLESFFENPETFSNEEIKKILLEKFRGSEDFIGLEGQVTEITNALF